MGTDVRYSVYEEPSAKPFIFQGFPAFRELLSANEDDRPQLRRFRLDPEPRPSRSKLPIHDSSNAPRNAAEVCPAANGRKTSAGDESGFGRKLLEIRYKSEGPDTPGQGNPSASGAHPVSELLFRYGAFASQ